MAQLQPKENFQLKQDTTVTNAQNEHLVVNFNYNIHFPNLVTPHNYMKKDSLSKELDKIDKVEQITEQQNQIDKEDPERKLPHIKVFDDKKEFNEKKKLSRPTSKRNSFHELPQVFEQKKQLEDQKQILSKLDNFVDRDEFNSKGKISLPHFLQNNQVIHNFETPIEEIKESEEPVQQKPAQKTILQSNVQKIIVDEIDSIKKHSIRKQQNQDKEEIEIIAQQKVEQEGTSEALRCSLHKLHSENVILKKIVQSDSKNDDQIIIPLQTQTVNLAAEPIEQRESEQQTENY